MRELAESMYEQLLAPRSRIMSTRHACMCFCVRVGLDDTNAWWVECRWASALDITRASKPRDGESRLATLHGDSR